MLQIDTIKSLKKLTTLFKLSHSMTFRAEDDSAHLFAQHRTFEKAQNFAIFMSIN